MNLRELVEELRCSILRDVSTRVTAVDEPVHIAGEQLWSNRALVRYIDDAERTFARRTRCLVSSRDEFCYLPLVAGGGEYELDSRVIDIVHAQVDGLVLRHVNEDAVTGGADVVGNGVRVLAPGTPQMYSFLRGTMQLRMYPAPCEASTLQLVVVRYPRKPLTVDNMDASPEIPEQYHLDLLEWAAWRAYRNHDVEVENFGKANGHKARFNEVIDEYNRDAVRRNPPTFVINARTY